MATTATAVRERPILMSGPMVRALLDGRKTQTRRVVKGTALEWLAPDMFTPAYVALPENHLCPYGAPGDRLWVKESWRLTDINHRIEGARFLDVQYRDFATQGYAPDWRERLGPSAENERWKDGETGVRFGRWRSSRFMPRRFSRLTLEVTGVRVERLWEMTEDDARAEGFAESRESLPGLDGPIGGGFTVSGASAWHSALGNFQILWEKLNGSRGFGWDANPFVWVIEFRRVGAR